MYVKCTAYVVVISKIFLLLEWLSIIRIRLPGLLNPTEILIIADLSYTAPEL